MMSLTQKQKMIKVTSGHLGVRLGGIINTYLCIFLYDFA